MVDANCTALVTNRGNTNLNSTDYLIGAAVSFTCPTGYIFSDNSFEKTAFCQANSQWSGNVNTQDFYCRGTYRDLIEMYGMIIKTFETLRFIY